MAIGNSLDVELGEGLGVELGVGLGGGDTGGCVTAEQPTMATPISTIA